MFDKRLMTMCPESKKYIAGNIICQWIELLMNAVMIYVVSNVIGKIYARQLTLSFLIVSLAVVGVTLIIRFFMTKTTTRMSYLASKTVKCVLREHIYEKLLKLGSAYREHTTTAELVQESVEGVDQLESYFGLYVPQFFYAFIAPVTLFVLFGIAGSFKVAAVLLVCVPLIPGAIVMVQKIAKKILAKYWDQYTKLGSTFLENLQGLTALKIYKADAYKNKQMNEESENFRKITMKVLMMQLNSIIIMDFFAYGGAALGIALAGKGFVSRENSMCGSRDWDFSPCSRPCDPRQRPFHSNSAGSSAYFCGCRTTRRNRHKQAFLQLSNRLSRSRREKCPFRYRRRATTRTEPLAPTGFGWQPVRCFRFDGCSGRCEWRCIGCCARRFQRCRNRRRR